MVLVDRPPGEVAGSADRAAVHPKLVDWATAGRVAGWLADRRSLPPGYDPAALQREFDEIVPEAEELVAAATGLRTTGGPSRARVAGRGAWARANVASFERLLGPSLARLEERRASSPVLGLRPLAEMSRVLSGTELGVVLAWLSGRVLGQYDLLLADEPAEPARGESASAEQADDQDVVYFVGPNVVDLELRHGFPTRQFRMWLALHEVTHRTQFTGVPWLKGYFLSLVDQGLEPFVGDPRQLLESIRRAAADARAGRNPLAEAGMLGLVATPEQMAVLHRVQALMSLLEGHGDVTMDRAGASVVPSAPRFRRVLQERRDQMRGSARLLQQLLGMEAKLRQYAQGEQFIRKVEERGGPELLARVWEGPELLPTLEEIRSPDQWVERVGAG